jgi:hypothetical protein
MAHFYLFYFYYINAKQFTLFFFIEKINFDQKIIKNNKNMPNHKNKNKSKNSMNLNFSIK